jgi:hypothetical protein
MYMPLPRSHHGVASGMYVLITSVAKSPHSSKPRSVFSSAASSRRCCGGGEVDRMVRWRCGVAKK